jgi:hypothetical protein
MYCVILEGGGVKGVAHVGAINAMTNYQRVTHVSGSSAGSQVAALIAAGFTPGEMKDIIWNLPLQKFMDSSWGYFRNIYRLMTKFGYCSGKFMEQYVDDILAKKTGTPGITFSQLYNLTHMHLKITATCLNDGNLRWFDHEKTPDMPVSKAVRISSSFPIAFTPVTWKGETFIDGGCLRNLPVNAFPGIPGIALDLDQKQTREWSLSFTGFVGRIIDVIVNAANRTHYNPLVKTIKIDTGTVETLDFGLGEEQKELLYDSGYNAIAKHESVSRT